MTNLSNSQKKWALAATIIASSMGFVNGSVVNVALPAIQVALDATVADMQWVISAYAFILGTLILTGGSAGDYYGRKRMFGLGIFIFLLSTGWCGLAPNVQQLIFGRGGQAIGGAFMIPGSLAIITDIYEEGQRGKAIGTWSAATALSTAAGPLLGGLLVDYLSWRFIFFISVPMALSALAILYWRFPKGDTTQKSDTPDFSGALLATVGIGMICYGLINGSERGITDMVVFVNILGGLTIMGGFIWNEKRVANPMVPLSLFSSKTFTGANLVTLFLYFALGGVFFLMPFNLIHVQGYSATAAGAAFIPFPLLVGGLSRWSGGLIVRYGARPLLVVGPALTSLGFLLLGYYGIESSYWTNFLPGFTFMGLGVAISFAPLQTTVMSSVKQSVVGTASGVNKAISRLSGMLAVALLGALVISIFGNDLLEWMQQNNVPADIQQQMLSEKASLAKAEIPGQASDKIKEGLKASIKKSFLHSYQLVMYLSSGLVLLGSICSALMVSYHPDSDEIENQRPVP